MKLFASTLLIVFSMLVMSCNNGPKVLDVTEDNKESNTSANSGIFTDKSQEDVTQGVPPVNASVHTAVAKEVLPTEKYVYVLMEENGEEFWIATVKQEVETGKTYFFKDGLLKIDFESKEYNRTFDRIFLVSSIVPANHGNQAESAPVESKQPVNTANIEKPIKVEGSISIADLVDNIEKYDGQEIQVSGVCTKINPNIMGRNWIHLEDGTRDDYDLVLTSDMIIPEGAVLTMKGKVATNLDFGAGYRYDILIENAQMVK